MPNQPAGAVKVIFDGITQGGEVFAHSFWFDAGTAPTQTDLELFRTAAKLTFDSILGTTAIKALFPTTTSYKNVNAYSYAGGPNVDRVAGKQALATWVGTSSSGLPNQCAMVLSLITGVPGRSFRGRSYLPGPGTGQLSSTGQISASTITALGTAWQGWVNGMQAGGGGTPAWTAIVASATRNAKTPLIDLGFDTRMDVQRRRAAKQVVTSVSLFPV